MELHNRIIPNTMELVRECKNAMMIMTVLIWTHLTEQYSEFEEIFEG